MKIKEFFRIGGIIQTVDGKSLYLDKENCFVYNRTKKEDAVILHIKRDSDGKEGNAYLRVKDEFKILEKELLNWAFISESLIGLTLNQLEILDTDLEIEKSSGKLNLVTH